MKIVFNTKNLYTFMVLNTMVGQTQLENLIYLVVCITCSLVFLLIHCFYANFVTQYLDSVSDKMNESNWHMYPVNLQKYLLVILARTQWELNFTGFGFFRCSVEIFGKVNQGLIFFIPESLSVVNFYFQIVKTSC